MAKIHPMTFKWFNRTIIMFRLLADLPRHQAPDVHEPQPSSSARKKYIKNKIKYQKYFNLIDRNKRDPHWLKARQLQQEKQYSKT
jgi:hypothetical protein